MYQFLSYRWVINFIIFILKSLTLKIINKQIIIRFIGELFFK